MKLQLFLAVYVIYVWSVDIQSIPREKLHLPSSEKEKLHFPSSEKSDFFGTTINELLKSADISNTNSTIEWSNPSSFIKQLVKTDPKKVTNIIKLLKELIVGINSELKSFADGMAQAKQKLDSAKVTHEDAKAKFDSSKGNLDSTKRVKDEAETKYTDAKTAYDVNKPVLLKHIQIVEEVIDKLGLLYSSKWELVVDVTDGKTTTNRAFWNGICVKHGNVTVNSIMKLTMGIYVDYFKPSGSKSFCSFLLDKKWLHSLEESGRYDVPPTGRYSSSNHFGGSTGKQPDGRCHLSFWGYDGLSHGGCCSTKKGECSWHRPFKMELLK